MVESFHRKLNRKMVIIQPGEYYVSTEDEVIATVLGSCISVCLKDQDGNVGGMNHFMLPGDFRTEEVLTSNNARYGMYAMELMLGDFIKMGGGRKNMVAKVFGGGHVLASVPRTANNVPGANIQFIKAFLAMEGIPVLKSDLGGDYGRKVLFLPRSGKAFVKSLVPAAKQELAQRESRYQADLRRQTQKEDLTLF